MKSIWLKIKLKYAKWKTKREVRKKLKLLQKKDPFIYK
jgi:hypothetical protein